MAKPRSPIEMMIDKACGFDPSGPAPERVTLRCPQCRRTLRVLRDDTDPENASTVEVICDKCDHGGLKPEVSYYDDRGNQIDIDGNAL